MKQIKPDTQSSVAKKKTDESESERPVVAPWRYGPAAYWYDQLDVPPSGEGFDYGFKLKDKSKPSEENPEEKTEETPAVIEEIPKKAFLLVNQLHWEDDIIWNPDDLRDEFARKISSGKQPLCGWIPMPQARTYEQFMALRMRLSLFI